MDNLVRKLAVLLHADVIGSTTLVQQNEALAHDRITTSFKTLARNIENYAGNVLETRGDALVAEFSRASDAACAAAAFQLAQNAWLEEFDDAIRPEIRIGISLGEVIVADDTVTGPGVVLAQRVEQLASPGGVCVTAAVHEALPGRMPFAKQDLGDVELKGFEEKIRVYRIELKAGEIVPPPEQVYKSRQVSPGVYLLSTIVLIILVAGYFLWQGFAGSPTLPTESSTRDAPSIAVLPFLNINNDREQDYFVNGLTEDLITDLSKVSGIFVIARGTVFNYRNKPTSPLQVAKELDVRYILEGSVRRAGNRLRINTQLTDANSGNSLWAERYDSELEDVFTIQDEITEKIVQALEVRLTAREESVVSSRATKNFDAYELFLKGQELAISPDRQGLAEGIKMYRRALDLDPGFSRAYGAIAIAMVRQYQRGYSDMPVESLNRALEIAQQAVTVGPDIPQGYWALGLTHLHRKEYELAITATQKAIEIAPNYADAHALLSFIYNHQGNHAGAIPSIKRAMKLNPYFTWEYLFTLGFAHYLAGEYRESIDRLLEALEKNATAGTPRVFLIASYVRSGDLAEAGWETEQLQLYNPEINLSLIRRTWAQADEIKNALIADLRKAGVPE